MGSVCVAARLSLEVYCRFSHRDRYIRQVNLTIEITDINRVQHSTDIIVSVIGDTNTINSCLLIKAEKLKRTFEKVAVV